MQYRTLLLLILPVQLFATSPESTQPALALKQLDGVKTSLERAQTSACTNAQSRYFFDYQVCRFKALTEEQRQLLRSVVKSPGQYTEGVVLSPRVEALFRVVPPALYLPLAMTEKHEKAERMRIMREMGCSEVEAARHIMSFNR